MAEAEKPRQLVQPSAVLASGITAIVAALFTSRLGVAGTLIGSAITPMIMTVGVAVLNAQIERATSKISDLPNTVRGQLSTQRVRVPGTPVPEEPEEPEPPAAARRRDRRTPGALQRVLSIPAYLKEMSSSTRRRVLLTGALAGLVAAAIGLAGVTGVEAASGSTLTCSVWNEECGSGAIASGQATGETGGTSLSRFFSGGSGSANDQYAPSNSNDQPGAQPAPNAGGNPQGGQYGGESQGGGQQQSPSRQSPSGQTPDQSPPSEPAPQNGQPPVQQPNAAPQDGSRTPSANPGAEQQQAAPSEQQQQ